MLHGISSPAPYLARLSRQKEYVDLLFFYFLELFVSALSPAIILAAEFDFDAYVVGYVDLHDLAHGPFIGFDPY
jgi:hypothetical protein